MNIFQEHTPLSTDMAGGAYRAAFRYITETTAARQKKQIEASKFIWVEPSLIPKRQALYAGHFIRGFMSLTLGVGGGGKSNQEIVDAIAMASNKDILGHQAERKLRVWYINLEDPAEEIQRRFAAAAIYHKVDPATLQDSIFVDSGRDQDFVVMKNDGKGTRVVEPVVQDIISEIIDKEIDVLIVDPFISTHEVEENDNTKIQMVAAQWVRIAHEADCAVELVHHVNKSAGDGKLEVTADSGRGAGALKDKARSVRVINGMSVAQAGAAGIPQEDRFDYFNLGNGKSNLRRRTGAVEWRHMVSVQLGNGGKGVMAMLGDDVGVVENWQWPTTKSVMEDVPDTALDLAKTIIRGGHYKAHEQAKNWAGLAVAQALEIDPSVKAYKLRAKTVLAEWLKAGHFKIITMLDIERRENKEFVVVSEEVPNPN